MGDPRWRERLNPVQDKAVVHLAGLLGGVLLDRLLARELLTENQYNNLIHVLGRELEENAARHLLKILRRRPDPSFSQFCEILLEIEAGQFLYQCLTDGKAGRVVFQSPKPETQGRKRILFWAMIVAFIAVSAYFSIAKPPSEPTTPGSSEIKPTQATPSTSQRKKAEQNKEYYQSEPSTQRETQGRRQLLFLAMIVALIAAGTYFLIAKPPSESEPMKPESSEIKPTQATPSTSHKEEKAEQNKENYQSDEPSKLPPRTDEHPPGSCEKIVMEALEDNPDALASSHPHEIHSQITLFRRTIHIVVKPYMPTDNPTKFQADILDIFKRKNNVGAESSISKEDAATKGLIKFCQKFKAL